jgi:ParB/RepB/Spo0J family partition protein
MTDAPNTLLAPMASFPEGSVVRLALDRIVSSRTNPRKTFNPEKLEELAKSIQASGVHSPILVRPLPGDRLQDTYADRHPGTQLPDFELVYGERRWRASRIAGVPDVPVVVRFLTDDQVLDIQITENLQRDDLLPLEEAEGYQMLMDHSKLSVDQVAVKIGKSKAYVYGKVKLLALCTIARDALRKGTIDASKALLLARIPDEALQVKALEEITDTSYDNEPRYSYRAAARYIQQNFMLRLDQARFKITDATLVPVAGPCPTCPKRTGYSPDLFADVDGADVCTDPKCFHTKEEAHDERALTEAAARGQTIITGREAKEMMPSSYNGIEGYKRLDVVYDSPTDKTLRKLIGKAMERAGVQPILIANPHKEGDLVAVLPTATVSELLKAHGHTDASDLVDDETKRKEESAKSQAEADAKRALQVTWRQTVLAECWKAMCSGDQYGCSEVVLKHVAMHFAQMLNVDSAKALAKILDLGKVKPKEAIVDWVRGENDPGRAVMMLVAFRDSDYRYWLEEDQTNEGLWLVAEECSVDRNAVKARCQANARAAKKEATESEQKSASPEAPLPQAPAAQASGVRGNQKTKGKKTSAAPAAESPKTSTAHASALIAEAMQALPVTEPGSADAPQSDEAVPVLRQAPEPAAMPAVDDGEPGSDTGAAEAAQSDEGQAVLRQPAATALPFVVGQAVRFKEGLRGPNRHMRKVCGRAGIIEATTVDGWLVRTGPGAHQVATASSDELLDAGVAPSADVGLVELQRVRINSTARGADQKQYVGRTGRILSKLGSSSWSVFIDAAGRKKSAECIFDSSELEVIAP